MFYEKRAVRERNPVAMNAYYEKLFEAAPTSIDQSFRACCVIYEKRPVYERKPFAMITHYESSSKNDTKATGFRSRALSIP